MVGVEVGVLVGVAVGGGTVAVGVKVEVAVAVGVNVDVAVAVGVNVVVAVAVGVGAPGAPPSQSSAFSTLKVEPPPHHIP